ncbi:degenerin deg-1-like isoform X2 [Stegodyphus dumicola]|uniref:degenerin deg-1-like isoform X2 n=1 Tax=Stegodyphus dumicola TaxID=202533 RepID=UPI0015ACAC40|nr:degenerin deg-1-like isoform X2 [Stegodyphus dumicola]
MQIRPFLRSKRLLSGSRSGCYSIYSMVDNSREPIQIRAREMFQTPVNTFTFSVDPKEIFIPGDRPGMLFSVHSPFEGVNPFERGIFMKIGRIYKLYVRMEKQILLPLPYKTNCMNYTEEWLKNNRSGPRTKKMCIHKCLLEASVKCFNCSASLIFYPNNARICSYDEVHTNCSERERLFKCSSNCKDDCVKIKYYFEVQERYEREYENPIETMEEAGLVKVEVYLDSLEIIRLQHRPQFRDVELFSYIGGFLGIWLGVSLVEVMDLLEALLRVFTYVFRKRRNPA